MAYSRQPAEHAFVKIERDLASGDIPPVVLLSGREDYLTEHYAQVLISRFIAPESRQLDLVSLAEGEVSRQALEENVQTLSLLSQRRVIYLPGFINRRGKCPKNLEQGKRLEDFMDYFSQIPEGVLVLITCEKPASIGDYTKLSDGRKLKKLQSAVTKAGGKTYDFAALDPSQLRGFIAKRFQKAGKVCTAELAARIARDTGYGSKYNEYDLFGLDNDLKKIIASSGDNPRITEQDLQGILTISPENNVFRMLDAISQGRKDQALIYLNTLLEDGNSEFGILTNIVRQVEMMLTARQLQEEGRSRQKIIAWLKKEEHAAEYRAKTAADAAGRLSQDRLKKMLLAAYHVEEHIKTGLMSPRLSLEYFISVS